MWTERDDFARTCIAMGLNARQIATLSLSSPQPLRTTQQVYDKIAALGLDRMYASRRVQNRRKGYHNQNIITVLMKLYGQALEYGLDVCDIHRDAVPEPDARFRPDLGLCIGGRRFFVEVQLSRIELTRWTAKMANYLRLYERHKRPFRALFLIDRAAGLPRVREYARWVLRERPNLNLFLFATLADFERRGDVLYSPVWLGAKGDAAALMR